MHHTRHTLRTAATFGAGGALALSLAACSGAEDGDRASVAASAPTTLSGSIEFWHFFSDREANAIQEVVDDFVEANPQASVTVKSGQDDQKVLQAIAAGQPIDVALSYSTDALGVLCSSGNFQDLAQYIERDKVDLTQIPDVVRQYTQYQGTRCAMPALADVYGLYYNKDLLAAAGYSQAPQTLDVLADMAVKLTTYNDDGSIKTLGFMPLMGYYANDPAHWASATGAAWLNEDGTSAIASSSGWAELMEWQAGLIEKLGGYEKLNTFQGELGQEYSAENDFQTGRVAMNLDGEYRTAFIADQAPDLAYGTAPFPTAQGHTDLYGGGYITGNIIGIGKGAKNPELAWGFIKYLTTDPGAQVKLANGIKNVPSWNPALTSPDLEVSEQYQTFLDIFESPHSLTTPVSPIGAEYQLIFGEAWEEFQSGAATDIGALLTGVDEQIDAAVALQAG